jgi:predicted amidohydrolase
MGARLSVACVQLTSTPEMAANIETACAAVLRAAADGANLVLLPENVALLAGEARTRETAAEEGAHPARAAFAQTAREAGVWLLAGSIAERRASGKLANRSLLIDAGGAVVAAYDKIHMFDVDLDGESYRESNTFGHGARAVLAETPWGGLGMTVCYDLRFPHLYRTLAQAGAHMLSVPSAFTRPTGRAHWHVLLRARAIENGAFTTGAAAPMATA